MNDENRFNGESSAGDRVHRRYWFAIARGLAESGAEVIVNGRSVDSVNKGIQALQQVVHGVQLRAAIADLSSQEGVDELLRVATHVDILVNNAGIYGQQDFIPPTTRPGTLLANQRDVRRAPLPCPVARHGTKGWGRVVFISSESACNIPADMIHYGVTKPPSSRWRAVWRSSWQAAA